MKLDKQRYLSGQLYIQTVIEISYQVRVQVERQGLLLIGDDCKIQITNQLIREKSDHTRKQFEAFIANMKKKVDILSESV